MTLQDYELIERKVTDCKLLGIGIDDFVFGLEDKDRPDGYEHVKFKMFGHLVTKVSYNSEIEATMLETYRLKD